MADTHAHEWIATSAALLSIDYPNFVIHYGCMKEDCSEEKYEVAEGQEL